MAMTSSGNPTVDALWALLHEEFTEYGDRAAADAQTAVQAKNSAEWAAKNAAADAVTNASARMSDMMTRTETAANSTAGSVAAAGESVEAAQAAESGAKASATAAEDSETVALDGSAVAVAAAKILLEWEAPDAVTVGSTRVTEDGAVITMTDGTVVLVPRGPQGESGEPGEGASTIGQVEGLRGELDEKADRAEMEVRTPVIERVTTLPSNPDPTVLYFVEES